MYRTPTSPPPFAPGAPIFLSATVVEQPGPKPGIPRWVRRLSRNAA